MGNDARNNPIEERRERELPPCAQAQSDGVPCTEVGRACEICEAALRAAGDSRDRVPHPPQDRGPLPLSGA